MGAKHKPTENQADHQKPSRPTWLLALEIVTGTLVGLLILTALVTTYKRFNSKSSMIIPWKKSGSDKERLAVSIGKSFTFTTMHALRFLEQDDLDFVAL